MYFVSTREEDDCKELYGGAWGYYWNRERAIDAVHRNITDMHETIYPYAIIEHLEPGLFPIPKEREWFGWDEEKDGYCESEIPSWQDPYLPARPVLFRAFFCWFSQMAITRLWGSSFTIRTCIRTGKPWTE